MNAKGWAISAGLGAAAGMVAVLMMPRNNPTRKLAAKAANKWRHRLSVGAAAISYASCTSSRIAPFSIRAEIPEMGFSKLSMTASLMGSSSSF